jgi:hypothetical protein
MTGKLYFTPAAGMKIPDPVLLTGSRGQTIIVPPEGKWVPDTAYWHRRAADGGGTLSATAPEPAKAGEPPVAP